jgi:exosortase/archaeosortase family protein
MQKEIDEFLIPIKKYYEEQIEKVKKDKKKQFTFFVLGFIVSYLILSSFAYALTIPAEIFTGIISEFLISLQGFSTTSNGISMFTDGLAYSFNINQTGQLIVISFLCTGLLEIAILISAMIASFGVEFKNKLIGIIGAIISGIIFNFIRIWITLNIILFSTTGTFEIAHDLLFRITLFLYITIFYILWFNWSNK